MKLSEYKKLLDLSYSLQARVESVLKEQKIPFDLVRVLESHESFLVLKIVHKGRERLQSFNLWLILSDKECKSCGD